MFSMARTHYLDNAATTYPFYHRRDNHYWMNPNTAEGLEEYMALETARMDCRSSLGFRSGKVFFGASSTAIFNELARYANEQGIILLGDSREHDAVWRHCFPVKNCTPDGVQSMLETHLKQAHVARMAVQNVTGEIFYLNDLASMVHDVGGLMWVDGTAWVGKAKVPESMERDCDVLVWSGHKIHTERGIGGCWLSERAMEFFGGADNLATRHSSYGTPDVQGAVMLAEAMNDTYKTLDYNLKRTHKLVEYMEHTFNERGLIYDNILDCLPIEKTPYINALHLGGIDARTLQNYLRTDEEVIVGLGASACADADDYHVLMRYGLSKEEAESVIRVSFSPLSSFDDVIALADGIANFRNKFM